MVRPDECAHPDRLRERTDNGALFGLPAPFVSRPSEVESTMKKMQERLAQACMGVVRPEVQSEFEAIPILG